MFTLINGERVQELPRLKRYNIDGSLKNYITPYYTHINGRHVSDCYNNKNITCCFETIDAGTGETRIFNGRGVDITSGLFEPGTV